METEPILLNAARKMDKEAVDEARSSQRRAPLEALISLRPDVRSVLLSSEDQIMFGKVLDAIQNDLTDRQRHVIILRFLEKFSLQETAPIPGKEASHVKGIQSRAIARLRRVFEFKDVRVAALLPRTREPSKSTGI